MGLRLTKRVSYQDELASLRSANRFMMAAAKGIPRKAARDVANKFTGQCGICPADDLKVQNRDGGQENHLQHGTYSHECSSSFVFLNSEACPYQDHSYTSCKTGKYQALTEARLIGKKGPCKPKLASVSLAVTK
jgi:hypothetical protein